MKLDYTLLHDWFGVTEKEGGFPLTDLSPGHRLLLVSGSSLTFNLELLFGSRVRAEVTSATVTDLDREDALYLEETRGGPAMERNVWLTVKGKRLVYARTVMPLDCIQKRLVQKLNDHPEEPLGRILQSEKVHFVKDRLEVGLVRCDEAAKGLGLDGNTPMVARRYRLLNRHDKDGWIIKAALTEVFSPGLIPCNEHTFC